MSALWRIYWLVSLFFGLIGTVCLLVLLRQASHDVGRELDAAQAMVTYLSEVAERDPAALQAELTDNLRHVRVRRLEPGQMSELQNGRSWLDYQIYPAELAGVMNFVIFPMFFLSSALYPLWKMREASDWLYWLCALNPFTHAVELVRYALYGQLNTLALAVCLGLTLLFSLLAVLSFNPQHAALRRSA